MGEGGRERSVRIIMTSPGHREVSCLVKCSVYQGVLIP